MGNVPRYVVRASEYHMKRAIAMLLMVAMVGSLMFMGFAGTAAAQEVDTGSDVDVNQDADSNAEVNTAQQNNNAQIQDASSYSSSDKSYAKTTAVQYQNVDQTNANQVSDVTSVASNNADTDVSSGINVTVDSLDEEPVVE